MRSASGDIYGTWVWNDVPVGGGGYITHMDIHPTTGRMFAGTDVQNGYLRDPGDSKWTTLLTVESIPDVDDYEPVNGAYGQGFPVSWFKFAPSDENRAYCGFNGFMFTLNVEPAKALGDVGAFTLTRWNLGLKHMRAGSGWGRWFGPGVHIHPVDRNIAIVGMSQEDGAYYTTDGGANVTQIALPASSDTLGDDTERYLVWIDQGDADFAYVHVPGSGLYRSTTGVAGTFSAVSGGPVGATCLFGETDGTLWVTGDDRIGPGGNASGGLWKLERGVSETLSRIPNSVNDATNAYPWHVAVDPFDSQHIVVFREQTGSYSTDRGATWNAFFSITMPGTGAECAWRVSSAPKNAGGIYFDPRVRNKIWSGEGFGVVFSNTVSPALLWVDHSAGIEEKIHNAIVTHPNTGQTFIASYDLPFLRVDSLTSYTNVPARGAIGHEAIQPCGDIDYAIDDPDFWVAVVGNRAGDSSVNHAYTADSGTTWRRLPNIGSGFGPHGSVAVGEKANIVLATTQAKSAFYTKDAGATWAAVSLGGNTNYVSGALAYYVFMRKTVAADKTRPGAFGLIVSGRRTDADIWDNPAGGFWLTTDGGDTWIQKFAGVIGYPGLTPSEVQRTRGGVDFRQIYACQLAAVPGFSGEWLYTPHADFSADRFWHSDDDGATWRQPNAKLKNVRKFAFGKNLPGRVRPAAYFYGEVSGVPRHWATFDWFQTFVEIGGKYPKGYINSGIRAMGADMTRFGRVFSTPNGKGSVYGDYRDLAKAT